MAVGGTDQWEFEQWYGTSRKALTGAAFLYVGNMDEALDLVQETYARAWQHWDVVSLHANRDAWSRLVLHNLAVSRWRRLARERALPKPIAEARTSPGRPRRRSRPTRRPTTRESTTSLCPPCRFRPQCR